MKRITTIIACILIAICSIHAQEQVKPSVTTLTKEQFIEKVWDYTGDGGKEWKYKGDKPAIIDFYAEKAELYKAINEQLLKEKEEE